MMAGAMPASQAYQLPEIASKKSVTFSLFKFPSKNLVKFPSRFSPNLFSGR
jgi:hypothetical protein